MTVRWRILVNPQAGRRPIDPEQISRRLDELGLDSPVEVPPTAEAMFAEVQATVEAGWSPAVVGGDGTAHLAVNALMTSNGRALPTLAVVPAGSGCDLMRTFGWPPDPVGSLIRLVQGSPYRVDVGCLDGGWGRRFFVNVAQAGVGAAAAASATKLPRMLGPVRYPVAFALRLPTFPRVEVSVEAERASLRSDGLAVILANGQFFAGGWNIAPKAMLVDGRLDVQVFGVRKRQAPALVPRIVKGLHLGAPGVLRRSLDRGRVETERPWPVEADGEPLGSTPFEFEVRPAAVDLWV